MQDSGTILFDTWDYKIKMISYIHACILDFYFLNVIIFLNQEYKSTIYVKGKTETNLITCHKNIYVTSDLI